MLKHKLQEWLMTLRMLPRHLLTLRTIMFWARQSKKIYFFLGLLGVEIKGNMIVRNFDSYFTNRNGVTSQTTWSRTPAVRTSTLRPSGYLEHVVTSSAEGKFSEMYDNDDRTQSLVADNRKQISLLWRDLCTIITWCQVMCSNGL
jgi:hypothetical protein